MLRQAITALLGSLALAAALPAGENQLPHVTVFGTATTEVTPDQTVWRLTVQNKGAKLAAVAEEHTKITQQVLGLLKQSGIKEADVQTSRMEFGENWEYRNQSRIKEGYFAATHVCFRTSNLAAYKPIWLGLAEISGVTVDGVYYDHSKRIAYQNDTRRKALNLAKEKAAELAKTLGSEIGEPLAIEEDLSVSEGWQQLSTSNAVNRSYQDRSDAPDGAGLAPGTIPIRMRVKVTFRLISTGK